jgi:GNAT superfamily N-acetyltransferase
VIVRPAELRDAEAIGLAHATAWAETYPGLVDDGLVSEMTDVRKRQAAWRGYLSDPILPGGVFLAELEDTVVGFSVVTPALSPELGTTGELKNIYLLRRAQGRGIGTALLRVGIEVLRARGHCSAGAWAAVGNVPAAQFYIARGATAGPQRLDWWKGYGVRQVGWVWQDINCIP